MQSETIKFIYDLGYYVGVAEEKILNSNNKDYYGAFQQMITLANCFRRLPENTQETVRSMKLSDLSTNNVHFWIVIDELKTALKQQKIKSGGINGDMPLDECHIKNLEKLVEDLRPIE